MGRGWPLRFKSNEVGLILNNCDQSEAEKMANELSRTIEAMEPVPAQEDIPEFPFSASIVWSVWPKDGAQWESFFSGTYAALMATWKAGGQRIIHYSKTETE